RSRSALRQIATSLSVTDKPALLLWGAKDPVFIDRYQHDLVHRIKNLDLHRYETAGHLIAEDRNIAKPSLGWLRQQLSGPIDPTSDPTPTGGTSAGGTYTPLCTYLVRSTDSSEKARVEITDTAREGSPCKL